LKLIKSDEFIEQLLSPQPRVPGFLRILFITIGIILTFLSLYLMITSSIPLLKAIGIEQAPKDALVISGIYSKMRNPIYTGCILGQIGWSMVWGAVYTLYLMPVFDFLICFVIVKFFEEPILTRKFGEQYEQYKRHVPAFFPPIIKAVLIMLAALIIIFTFIEWIPIS